MARHKKTVTKRKIVPLPLPAKKKAAIRKPTGRLEMEMTKTTGRKRK